MLGNSTYLSLERRTFHFNDHVCVEGLLGQPDENRTGRLVQVRKGVGAFGSDVFFLRLRDGRLWTFSNALIRHVDDEQFVEAFYSSNGRRAPVIPDQAPYEGDSIEAIYTISNEWPEIGFIIEQPKQPASPTQSFSMIITHPEQ